MIIEKAYAKINLILNVLDKRPDGFHEVDFVMSTLDLYDTVTIQRSDVDCFVVENYHVKMEHNLCYKAWVLLKQLYNLDGCLDVHIDKRIMMSAGMAGGSSDCAAVIRGVNTLFSLNISFDEMAKIGAKLGSDVPFCIYQVPMRAQGRGEVLTPVTLNYEKMYVVVVNPGVELSTKKVYVNHTVNNNHGDIGTFLAGTTFADFNKLLHNDLQDTAINLEPKITEIVDYVNRFGDFKWLVSGSGPTVLFFTNDFIAAKNLSNYCLKKYKDCFVTEMR